MRRIKFEVLAQSCSQNDADKNAIIVVTVKLPINNSFASMPFVSIVIRR